MKFSPAQVKFLVRVDAANGRCSVRSMEKAVAKALVNKGVLKYDALPTDFCKYVVRDI